ncbi:hypothetical protein P3S67_021049 [Capsicum chacoense]
MHAGSTNRFNGLSNRFNTTIEINPPYPQAAALKTWMKTIEPELVAYKMKSTIAVGSILLVPFEDEIIPVANIKEQLSGQVFYVEAELSFTRKDQHLCVLHCPSYMTLFSRYNVRREIYCTTCHRSTLLTPKCHFEVIFKIIAVLQLLQFQMNLQNKYCFFLQKRFMRSHLSKKTHHLF